MSTIALVWLRNEAKYIYNQLKNVMLYSLPIILPYSFPMMAFLWWWNKIKMHVWDPSWSIFASMIASGRCPNPLLYQHHMRTMIEVMINHVLGVLPLTRSKAFIGSPPVKAPTSVATNKTPLDKNRHFESLSATWPTMVTSEY